MCPELRRTFRVRLSRRIQMDAPCGEGLANAAAGDHRGQVTVESMRCQNMGMPSPENPAISATPGGAAPARHVLTPEPEGRARAAVMGVDATFTYDELDAAARRVAGALLQGRDDLKQGRVAFLVPASAAYAAVQRGIWRAGGVAVPLAVSHPAAELQYVIRDSGAGIVVAAPAHADAARPL